MTVFTKSFNYLPRFFLLILLLLPAISAHAETAAARIVSMYGDVWVSVSAGSSWRKISKPENLYIGSSIRTGRLSGVSLRSEDETLIRLAQDSQFKIEGVRVSSFWRRATSIVSSLARSAKSTYHLLGGKLWGRNNNRNQNLRIATSTATIGIRGTEFTIEASADSTQVSITEGTVEVANELGKISIGSGEQGIIERAQVPTAQALSKQRDSVQWMVPIPEILDIPALLKQSVADKKRASDVFILYRQQQYAAAADKLKPVIKKQPHNMRLWLLNAWLHIKGGESAGVYKSLKILAKYSPDDIKLNEVAAFAAFINGHNDEAGLLLDRLQSKHPLSDSGWVVRGYLAQAKYDLSQAAQSFEQAAALNSRNTLASVELAKVYFGSDQSERALHIIQQVIRKRPQNVAAQNLKSFILLAQNETDTALANFEKLRDDLSADAETYFGLSLAYMRQGRVKQAMQSIASALLLDTQRSMYLSYWGKMLHQIGRYDKALTVLDSAIRLDPQDPTPHLYRAIVLRDLNRPSEAIQQLQMASQLNDNRAIFRSRALLDQDLAVQNVDLSRLYTRLGLANWVQKKAQDAIRQDFTNFSAHVQNSGAYQAQQDRAYAKASEALLARMMQPANINTFAGFNTYSSLFETPGNEFNIELAGGNHGQRQITLNTNGADVQSRLAWSATALTQSTDGWRDDNGESFSNLSLMGKWQPDRVDNVLLAISASENETLGDFNSRFEVDAATDDYARFNLDSLQLDVGWQHRINENHQILTYLSLSDVDFKLRDTIIDQTIVVGSDTLTQERRLNSIQQRPQKLLQLQGIFQQGSHQLKYGLVSFKRNNRSDTSYDYGLFDPEHKLIDALTTFDERLRYNLDIQSLSVYLQDSWQALQTLDVDMAIYLDDMDNANALTGGEWTLRETTARLGFVWKPTQQHAIRLAHFRYLLPFLSARLDPTDVAGIPFFRATNEGSLVTESDLVWDFEWSRGLLSTALYRVEERYTSSVLQQGQQLETTTSSEKNGLDIRWNSLLGVDAGLTARLSAFSLTNEANASLSRDERIFTVGYKRVLASGFSFGLEQIFRHIDFEQARETESIAVTSLTADYIFADRSQQVTLLVDNVFNREFNWISDEFNSGVDGIAPQRLILLKYGVYF
jgi:tetratricopeptide (TPR) repeat protein